MLAVDTNIVVRYLAGDDPVQAQKARVLLEEGDAFVSDTVLLETEWVLRTALRVDRRRMAGIISAFVGLPRVHVADRGRIEDALQLVRRGMDFTDALHLVNAQGCDAFVTFDRKLAKKAGQCAPTPVRLA